MLLLSHRSISIHAPHARSDDRLSLIIQYSFEFQSTLLMRGATSTATTASTCSTYFNPRSSCEERQLQQEISSALAEFQSTLLMRRATRQTTPLPPSVIAFQSTLLIRGATPCWYSLNQNQHFNPRSSCEERRPRQLSDSMQPSISIHAPHARSDVRTPDVDHCVLISIHAPHARSDQARVPIDNFLSQFQSTLLMRGATGEIIWDGAVMTVFQATLLMRGATAQRGALTLSSGISIHAPHARSDILPMSALSNLTISIHAPHARSDLGPALGGLGGRISIHAPHTRSDHRPALCTQIRQHDFNPRSSCEERLCASPYSLFCTSYFNPRSSCEERHQG